MKEILSELAARMTFELIHERHPTWIVSFLRVVLAITAVLGLVWLADLVYRGPLAKALCRWLAGNFSLLLSCAFLCAVIALLAGVASWVWAQSIAKWREALKK